MPNAAAAIAGLYSVPKCFVISEVAALGSAACGTAQPGRSAKSRQQPSRLPLFLPLRATRPCAWHLLLVYSKVPNHASERFCTHIPASRH